MLRSTDGEQKVERTSCLSWPFCVVFVFAAVSVSVASYIWRPSAGHNPISMVSVNLGSKHGGSETELPVMSLTDKPVGDKRSYQYTQFPNGLKAVNIFDETSLKDSFAVSVKAGSFDDPEDLPGLAHFCEHMLFLGTKKFPDPMGFDKFMSMSGGENNAYTSTELTVYFGSVSKSAGKEALARFADFFRAPLFNEKYVEKEVHAIDSEHAKNLQNPTWRIMQALNSLSDPKSPVGRFHTGNAKTLSGNGTDPVAALKVYFKGHYCPQQMSVVTFGSRTLSDQLSAVAREFASLPKGSADGCGAPRQGFGNPDPYPAKRMGNWMTVESMQPQTQLWLHFPAPDVRQEYRSQPLQYLSYVLGYRGPDSLNQVLTDNLGLVTSFNVGFDTASSGTSMYAMIQLTEAGRSHMDVVLDVFFAYLAVLRRLGVDEALYSTVADTQKLDWDWSQPPVAMSAASDMAEKMTRLPPQDLLSGDGRIDKQNTSLVASLLERWMPNNMNVACVQPNASEAILAAGIQPQLLPHYHFHYGTQAISDVLPGAVERWLGWLEGHQTVAVIGEHVETRVRSAGFQTSRTFLASPPKPIKDVPKDISLTHMRAVGVGDGSLDQKLYGLKPAKLPVKKSTERTNPVLSVPQQQQEQRLLQQQQKPQQQPQGGLLQGRHPELWYRSGWVTNSPKVGLKFEFRPLRLPSEDLELPVFDTLRLVLYNRLLSEEITPKMVDLTATGVSYDVLVSRDGVSFNFGGFAPVLPRLIDTVLHEFNRFNADATITAASRFQRVRQQLREQLTTYEDMPIQYAIQDRNMLLSPGGHSNDEVLAVIDNVTSEAAVKSAAELVLSRPLQLMAIAMGNLEEDAALKATQKISSGMKVPHISDLQSHDGGTVERIPRVVRPSAPIEVRKLNPRKGDPNDAVVISLVAGVANIENRVLLGLIGEILRSLTYSELRTKRQLGYVVSAGTAMISNVQYVSAIVQGNVLRADDLEAAVEEIFQELMPKRLKELSSDEFAAYVESYRQAVLQPPTSTSDELIHFLLPISQGGKCFKLHSELLRYLDSPRLTRERLSEVWGELATPKEGPRNKLVVKYFAKNVPVLKSPQKIRETALLQGLSSTSVQRLVDERSKTIYFDGVDSKARAAIAKAGGYYPQDLKCKFHDDSNHAQRTKGKHSDTAFLGIS